MIFFTVSKARYSSGEVCCLCLRFISVGQFFVRTDSKVAHYRCAKEKKWKKAKPKKIVTRPVEKSEEKPLRVIKIIKRKD